MTSTRRELLKQSVLAAVSALPLTNLASKLFASKTKAPIQGSVRVWLNNYKYNFELDRVRVSLELFQQIRTDEKGVHFKIGDRQLKVVVGYREPQNPQPGEWQHRGDVTFLFNLDTEGWEIHRQRAMELLGTLPVHVAKSGSDLIATQYEYHRDRRVHVSALSVTRAFIFTHTCERYARIIEGMTFPDQISIEAYPETYPELSPDQAGHGSH